ncbi:3-hydroxybutyryl-CoA dehydrogenase [Hazenella sp. IB182357]|uniref:3-hydroxybutyryl-CoA dehydrogenase n=1 Tax=Polycladospora coralii TaxID=2771432 RepID=A0A926N733_9BACL|nr:3-hydroxyacyl-CoA dehydrogenase family protein [Polycladospora coralii]MBD1373046.1 3-hydroxybutyryl-CoA dehydrogenase [Polycladospora coralii]
MNRTALIYEKGEGILFHEVSKYFKQKKIEVITHTEFTLYQPQVDIVIDLDSGFTTNKRKWLSLIEQEMGADIPIFSSAHYYSATEMASWLIHPTRLVGFSPLAIQDRNILEVSRPLQAKGIKNEDEKYALWQTLGKTVEEVADEPGLVFPRTIAMLVNEAVFAWREQVASQTEIDIAMKKGTNFPFGPFEWADQIGIASIVAILSGLYREFGEERYRPAPYLKKMFYANAHFDVDKEERSC